MTTITNSFDDKMISAMIHSMSRPATAEINIEHLQYNYRLLDRATGTAAVMAIVKANAYGHGLQLVGPPLLEAGCRLFGVTDADEGTELRSIIGDASDIEITMLSGIFDDNDARLCIDHNLTPVITEPAQLNLLSTARFGGAIWLKLDSGMNRLGALNPTELFDQTRKAGIHIHGFMSHLACADIPDHELNQQQIIRFNETCDSISPETPKSLLNSAGIIAMSEHAFDVVRPGIALYGAEPIPADPIGLKPVMTLNGEVMQVREIPAGASVSYGATFTTEQPMRVAVVSLGYADGVPRSLSNKGMVYIRNRRFPIIGRVCMDYTMVDVTASDVHAGDSVEFWGEHLLANEVASTIDTISYTLFTGIGNRVRRKTV